MTDDTTPDAGSPFAEPAAQPAPQPDQVASPETARAPELAPAAAQPPRRRRRGGVIAGFVLAGLVIVGLAVLCGYLWNVHSEYVAQNEELRDAATELGGEVATVRAQYEQLKTELDDTVAQLNDAKASISDLANSEAQAGDDRQALVDVTDALQECADARQNLINHLKEAYKWTPESLRANEASVTQYCNKVIASYKAIIND